ncbi:bacteriocin-like protein [Chryseobacterium sp. MMS23-Vi53]|uniref:bacteriocin-like protein n=1 Tax=Chryseobacterium sp. MMS23-Vi53 TaxID=3386644 RepID=UPI0039E9F918
MKNLKKLDRNQLKTISGEGLLDDLIGTLDILDPVVKPIVNTVNNVFCTLECITNGVVQIKLLPCGSTC